MTKEQHIAELAALLGMEREELSAFLKRLESSEDAAAVLSALCGCAGTGSHGLEMRARSIIEHVSDGIITIDEHGSITSFNRAAEHIFGYTAAEILGQNVRVLMPEDIARRHDGYLRSYIASGQSRCLGIGVREVFGRHKSGRLTPLDLATSESRDADTRMFIGIVRDVAERKRIEERERRLSGVLEQTADSVVVTDRHGVVEYVNQAFETVTGFKREEVVGLNANLVKSGLQDREFYQRLWQTILRGEVFRETFVNRRKDGSIYFEDKTITPFRDSVTHEITHFISTGKDITQQLQVEQRLQHLAHYDALTELPNRALFVERLGQAVIRGARHDKWVAVVYVDVDRFKVINASAGYQTGDSLLREVAQRLRGVIREGDTVARLGGDEFAFLFEDITAIEDVVSLIRKLFDATRAAFHPGGQELFVSVCAGISVCPSDGEDATTLMRNAESAMYQAKAAGPASYRFYTADMNSAAGRRLDLETGLRKAIDREEFHLFYQPQVDLRDGRIVAVEALLRWKHPQLGLIPPGDFIPILEETGLIVPVGEWVLRSACRQSAAWREAGLPPLRLAVNLSALQFQHRDIVAITRQTLRDTALPPGDLELELTESVIMHDAEEASELMGVFAEMGVRLAVDDFGTGYSSLTYLKAFPMHTLKLAQPFVEGIPRSPGDVGIAKAVIAMAHSLGLSVVAEGVETEAQAAFLADEHCDAAQGYWFSRPVEPHAIAALVRGGAATK